MIVDIVEAVGRAAAQNDVRRLWVSEREPWRLIAQESKHLAVVEIRQIVLRFRWGGKRRLRFDLKDHLNYDSTDISLTLWSHFSLPCLWFVCTLLLARNGLLLLKPLNQVAFLQTQITQTQFTLQLAIALMNSVFTDATQQTIVHVSRQSFVNIFVLLHLWLTCGRVQHDEDAFSQRSRLNTKINHSTKTKFVVRHLELLVRIILVDFIANPMSSLPSKLGCL